MPPPQTGIFALGTLSHAALAARGTREVAGVVTIQM